MENVGAMEPSGEIMDNLEDQAKKWGLCTCVQCLVGLLGFARHVKGEALREAVKVITGVAYDLTDRINSLAAESELDRSTPK